MKKIIIIIMTLIIYLHSPAQTKDRKYIRQGNKEYVNNKYEQAEVLYRKALEKNINSRKAEYNLANALYKQHKNDAAATKYKGLTENEKDRIEKSKFYYNMGNALFNDNKINESIEAYKNALRCNPNDQDAKHNLQMALRMKNGGGGGQGQQNQQKQQKQQNQQNHQNQQNQDKQKQSQNNQQNQQNEQQDKQDPRQQNQSQSKQGQISREDAERLLQAIENDEKKVLQKVKEKQSQIRKVQVEKDW
jgi:tetratricopeptide (TPR) repeat protein